MSRTILLALLVLFLTNSAATAQRKRDSEAQRPAGTTMIALEVLIIQTKREAKDPPAVDLSGTSEEVAARVRELEKAGKLDVVDRVRLTTLEGQPAMVQVGRSVAVETGSTPGRGFPTRRSFQQRQFGTLVSVTAKVAGQAVLAEINVEKSQLARPSQGKDAAAKDDSATPTAETTTAQTTVRIPDGKTVLVGGMATKADARRSQVIILASARVLKSDAPKKRAALQMRVFPLKNAVAKEAGDAIRAILSDSQGAIHIVADERTNSLVVRAEESRFKEIEAILRILDRDL